jgi:hypothetical protein
MTKRLVSAALVAACVLAGAAVVAWPGEAEARRGGRSAMSRDFGLGLIIGAPTGLSAELRLGSNTSLDFALGLERFDDDELYLHFDYLVYPVDLASGGSVAVPLYLGVGAILWDRGNDFGDDLSLGVRVPFGLALAFRRAPVQIFFELAVRLIVVEEVDRDDDVDLTGGVGFRVYF